MISNVWSVEKRRTATWTGGAESYSGQLSVQDPSEDDDTLVVQSTELIFGTSYDDDIDD